MATIANLMVTIGADTYQLQANLTKATTAVKNFSRNATTGANSASRAFGDFSASAAIAAAVIIRAYKEIYDAGKDYVDAYAEMRAASVGLQSILQAQGRDFASAQAFIESYTKDGLILASEAITAYKNLAARGYDDTQIQSVLSRLKDAAAFGRQASYTLGEAVRSATEGLKNENSLLVDNAGVTKNVAKMWDEYARAIGTSAAELTQAQKIQAEYVGIMNETRFQVGDAARYSAELGGQFAMLQSEILKTKQAMGSALAPALQSILPPLIEMFKAIQGGIQWFNGLSQSTKTMFVVGALLLGIIPLLIVGVYGLSLAYSAYIKAVAGASGATVAFIGITTKLLGVVGIILLVFGILSAIFGKTKSTTASVNDSFAATANTANNAASGLGNMANGVKKLGGAIKGLSLAGFDEINQLNRPGGGGGINVGINQGDLSKMLSDLASVQDAIGNINTTVPEIDINPLNILRDGFVSAALGAGSLLDKMGIMDSTWQDGWDIIMASEDPITTFWNGLVDLLGGGIEWWGKFFTDQWDAAVTDFKAKLDTVKVGFAIAGVFIKSVWGSITGFFSGIWNSISNAATSAWTWVMVAATTAWTWVTGVWTSITGFFSRLWDGITSSFKSVINSALGNLQWLINKSIDGLNALIGLLNKIPGTNIAPIGHVSIPRLAMGGIVDNPTIAMIGERGREAVLPLENNTGWMDKLADKIGARMGGGPQFAMADGPAVIVQMDSRQVARRVRQSQQLDNFTHNGR